MSIEWHKKRSRTNNNVDDNVYDDNDDANDDAGNGVAPSDCNGDGDANDDDDDDVCLMVDVVVCLQIDFCCGPVSVAELLVNKYLLDNMPTYA